MGLKGVQTIEKRKRRKRRKTETKIRTYLRKMNVLTISSKAPPCNIFPFSFAFAFSWEDWIDTRTLGLRRHIYFNSLFFVCVVVGFQFSFTRYTVFTTRVVRERRSGWAAFFSLYPTRFHFLSGSSLVIPFCCHRPPQSERYQDLCIFCCFDWLSHFADEVLLSFLHICFPWVFRSIAFYCLSICTESSSLGTRVQVCDEKEQVGLHKWKAGLYIACSDVCLFILMTLYICIAV